MLRWIYGIAIVLTLTFPICITSCSSQKEESTVSSNEPNLSEYYSDSAIDEKNEIKVFFTENTIRLEELDNELLILLPQEPKVSRLYGLRLNEGIIEYITFNTEWKELALSSSAVTFCEQILDKDWLLDVYCGNNKLTHRFFIQPPRVYSIEVCVSRLHGEILEKMQLNGISDFDNQEWWNLNKYEEVPELISIESDFYIYRRILVMP